MTSSRQRLVVIDDSDPQIHYTSEEWFSDNGSQDGVGSFGPPYNHTQHGTKSNGTLSYVFQGTSVAVLGTIDVVNTTLGFDPSWECFVDNISISIGPDPKQLQHSPENNQVLCEREHLNDESHNITVKISTTGRPFWLDYIKYNPSPSLSLETAVIRVESGDTGVLYGTNWKTTKGGLARSTQVKDSSAKFSFTGTSVTWVGFISPDFPHNASSAVYAIDGNPPTPFHLNGPLPDQGAVSLVNQIFFTIPELPAGQHTLVVTHQGTGDQTPLTLDYLYVTNTSAPTGPGDPTSFGHGSSSGPGTSDTHNPRLSPAAFLGILVVCGVISIAITLFLFFWWHKRRRRHRNLHLDPEANEDGGSISPFAYTTSTTHGATMNVAFQSVLGTQLHIGPVTKPDPLSARSRCVPPDTLSVTFAERKTTQQPETQERNLQPAQHPILHQDSGLRLHGETVIEDMPPVYTAD